MWFSWFSFGGRFRETADASCSRDSISTSQTGTTSSTSNQLVFPALFESGSSPLRRPFIHPLDLHVTTNFPTSHDEFIGLWFSNSSYHHCLFWVFFSSGFGIRMSSTSFGPCMHTCFPVSNEEAQSSIMILIDFYWMWQDGWTIPCSLDGMKWKTKPGDRTWAAAE